MQKTDKTSHACVPLTSSVCCRLLMVTPNHGIIFARALTVSDRDDESTRRERYGGVTVLSRAWFFRSRTGLTLQFLSWEVNLFPHYLD
jgi:hypothetical protein